MAEPRGSEGGSIESRGAPGDTESASDAPGVVSAAQSDGTPAIAVESEPQAETEKESEMIDVHAPHGGVHTWKDFWIHLGTITLGLLIAISLEQSVEWLHHLHQRHQLEEDLRAECEANHRHAENNIAVYDKIVPWLIELQRDVEQARAAGGKTAIDYPPRPDGVPDSPRWVAYHVLEAEAWTTAKESSLLVLMPRNEAEAYARLYIQADQVQSTRERVRDLGIAQSAFETRYAHGTYPPQVEIAKLSPDQLEEYDKLLSEELEAVRIARVRLRIFAAANDYVMSGGTSEEEVRRALLKANTTQ